MKVLNVEIIIKGTILLLTARSVFPAQSETLRERLLNSEAAKLSVLRFQ